MRVFISSPRARLRVIVLFIIVAATAGLLERTLVSGVQAVISLVKSRIIPIYCVETQDKKVALSFDATWGAQTTEGLLGLLKDSGVKTTFFLAGYWLEKYPDIVKQIAEAGHELGNHTFTHPHCNSLTDEEMRHELMETHALIKNLSGQEAFLFRPPFGEYNDGVIQTAKSMGYETIMWDVDSLDWKDLSSQEIHRRVMARIKPGSIILFHNAGKNTQPAVASVITDLKKDGYDIVTISELLLTGDTYVDHTGRQRLKSSASTADSSDEEAVQVSSSWSSDKWALDEGGEGFDAVLRVVSSGISKVITKAGNAAWYRGNPDRKEIAFAINVAWGEEHLPAMLKTLRDANVKGTFFFVGSWVRMFPELTKEIADAGHEVANHGYQHVHPRELDDVALENHIALNRELLRETIGREPSVLYGPPYGEVDERVIDAAGRLGIVTTLWTVDTVDWKRPSAQVIVDRVVKNTGNGTIVLMHPTGPTVEALPNIISHLNDMGYRIVPVTHLLR